MSGYKRSKQVEWWEIILLVLAGILCHVLYSDTEAKVSYLQNNGILVSAKVIDKYSTRIRTTSVVLFSTREGDQIITEVETGTTVIGQPTLILYDPFDPSRVILAETFPGSPLWILEVIFWSMAAFGILLKKNRIYL